MIKRAPSIAQLAAMVVFALTCFSLILFLWISFGGSVPLKPQGYRFSASFDEAVQLAFEADVRISGVSVGKVKTVTPSLGRTDALIELQERYAPLPSDSKATLRTKTLLGETYIELTPGTKGRETIPENGRLDTTSVSQMVELDEVIRTFDPRTRRAYGDWLVGQADALEGRGAALNQAFGTLPIFFSDSNDLLTVLRRQDRALSRIFANSADTFEAIAGRRGQLTDLITAANQILLATSHRSEQLAQTFREFPDFIRESRTTLKRFTEFTKRSRPLIENSTDFAKEFGPTVKQASKVTGDARRIVTNLEPLLDAADSGLPAADEFFELARPTIGQLDPFLRNLNPILEWVGLYRGEITSLLGNISAASQSQYNDKVRGDGHVLRSLALLTPDALAYLPQRTTASRSNAYPAPRWLAEDRVLAAALQVFDNAQCGTIAVPPLDPDLTQYPADLKTTDGTSILPQIEQIVYAGDDSVPLPAPVCDQQVPFSFSGETTEYPHVRERTAP